MSDSQNNCDVISITPFNVTCVSTPASGPNIADGTAQIFVQGGTPPYQYVWNHGPVGQTLNNLLPGTYTCTVSDQNSDNVKTVDCVVEAPLTVHKFELCVTESEQDLIIVLREVNYPDNKIYFEISGSNVLNIPDVGEVVSIDTLGQLPIQSGLRTCCYERLSYNPNDPGIFLGYFGFDETSKIIFSSPSACSSLSISKKKLPSEISLFTEDESKNQRSQNFTKNKSNYKILKFNKTNFIEIRDLKPNSFKTMIPFVNKKGSQEFELEKFQPFPSNITVGISDGANTVDQVISPKIVSYRMRSGKDDWGTMIFDGERVTVNLNTEGKQLAFRKFNENDDDYAIFDANDITEDLGPMNCATNTNNDVATNSGEETIIQKSAKNNQTCTSIALDVDNTILNKYGGNVQQTTDFVLSRMAIASDVYYQQTGGLRLLQVSYVNIWSNNPPYKWNFNINSQDAASATLSGLRSYWNNNLSNISRNLVHHMLTTGPTGGVLGVAYRPSCNGSCTSGGGYGVTRFLRVTTDPDFATYETRSLKTLCHELGHNFCSPHAHDCGLNQWGKNPETGNNWKLNGECGSQDPDCDLYPYSGPPTIMSYCSVDQLIFHPKTLSDKIIPNVSLSPNCLTECIDGTLPPPPPPPPGGGDSPSSCDNQPIYIPFNLVINAIVSNEELLSLGKVYEFAQLGGKYEYKGTTTPIGFIYDLTIIQEFDSCDDVLPPPPPPTPQHVLCLSDQVENQYEFQPGLFDPNGNQTWYNNEFDLTIVRNVDLNRWEVNTWSNVGFGDMVQYTNQSVPTGSWNNIGVSNSENWILTIGECTGIPLSITTNSEPESCVGLSDGSVTLLGNGGIPPYTFTIVGVSPPWPDFVSQAYYNNLVAGTYVAKVKDSTGSIAETSFNIGNGSTTNQYIISVNQEITSQSETSTSISKSGTYNINLSPSLLLNTSISFKVEATLVFSYDNTGSVAYSSNLETYKNGYPLQVGTTSPLSTSESYCDGENIKYSESFKYVSETIQYTSSDSVYGNFDYEVVFNSISTNCNCPTNGSVILTFDIVDLEINGGNCETINRSPNQPSSNVSTTRCEVLPTPTPTVTQTLTATPEGTPPASPNRTPDITPTYTRTPSPTPIPREKAECKLDGVYNFNEFGLNKILLFDIEIGNQLGQYGIIYDVLNNAKRFQIIYNGNVVADSLFVGDPGGVQVGATSYTIWDDYDINGENVTYNYFGEPFGGELLTITDSIIDTTSTTGMLTFDKTDFNANFMTIKIYSSNVRTDFAFIIDPVCNDLPVTPTPTPTQTNIFPTYTPTPTPTATVAILPVECGSDLGNLYGPGNGIFDIEFSLGNQELGTVEVTFNAFDVMERFQIIYGGEIVADSLFVGDSNLTTTWNNSINAVEAVTELDYYIYNVNNCQFGGFGCFGDPIGSQTVSYNSSDIAPDIPAGRQFGGQGNQLGIVPNFPSSNDYGSPVNSSWGEVKLTFERDSLEFQTMILRVISIQPPGGTTFFSISDITCPFKDNNVYFKVTPVCNFTDTPFDENIVMRVDENQGWQVGQFIFINHPNFTDETGPYEITEFVGPVENYVSLTTDNTNGAYGNSIDVLNYSYNNFNIGCRATFESCCDGGENGGSINGTTVNFTVNEPILEFSPAYFSSDLALWDYFGIDNPGAILSTVCVKLVTFDSSVPENDDLKTIFIENGTGDAAGCLSGRCLRCVKRVKICGTSTIINVVLEPDVSYDYSVGKVFFVSENGLTDDGYASNCFEIVDPSTTLTDPESLLFPVYSYDHQQIVSCASCLT
jgi:hypothetical protein